MRIRPAVAEDIDAVVALERELFGADAWSAPSVVEELTGPRRRALVAVDAEVVVGYAVTLLAGDVVDLQRVAVAPPHRRTGAACRLLEELAGAALADGAERMLLEVSAANEGALAFYAARGFGEIDRRPRYYRDGSDALVLAVALDPAAPRREAG